MAKTHDDVGTAPGHADKSRELRPQARNFDGLIDERVLEAERGGLQCEALARASRPEPVIAVVPLGDEDGDARSDEGERDKEQSLFSENDDRQARDLSEAAAVARSHAIAQGNRRGSDQEIVGSDARPLRCEACPKRCMDPRRHEVEREDRKHGEEPLDERRPALPLRGRGRPVNAVQEFGSGDGGNPDGVLGVRVQGGVEVERQALRGDQDRRIDQRPQGDRGGRP